LSILTFVDFRLSQGDGFEVIFAYGLFCFGKLLGLDSLFAFSFLRRLRAQKVNPAITATTGEEKELKMASRFCERAKSRCLKSSNPTPSRPATRLRRALHLVGIAEAFELLDLLIDPL
jgi:hypothetical protein